MPPSRQTPNTRPFWKPQLALCGSCAWSTGSSHYWGWCNLVQNFPHFQRGNPRSYGATPELPDTYIIHHGPPEGFYIGPWKVTETNRKVVSLPSIIISKCYKVLLFSWMMIWSYDQSLETARHMNQSCFRIHLTFNYPTKQIVHSHE